MVELGRINYLVNGEYTSVMFGGVTQFPKLIMGKTRGKRKPEVSNRALNNTGRCQKEQNRRARCASPIQRVWM